MASSTLNDTLRTLPQVEELLRDGRLAQLAATHPRALLVDAAREAIDAARQGLLSGTASSADRDAIAADAEARALAASVPSLRRVINATGVVIHTNLGRSPLAKRAAQAAVSVAEGYSTLEYDVDAMARGSRHAHCEKLLCLLTGAEAAMAVNNNAAAVLLVLTEFAKGRQAVVSRGELVEIGGSFRIPDIMELSGAEMVEVGTTNKTRARDYRRAIGSGTAMLLKVHPSNFRIEGFTESASVKELRLIADEENRRRDEAALAGGATTSNVNPAERVLVYEDQGSGSLVRLDPFANSDEPTASESLRSGCDLVSFSGDKLLGGPQAGIIVGAKPLIDRLKANPLARALRLDKMTLAALEETLRIYVEGGAALQGIPAIAMISATREELAPRAEQLRDAIQAAVDPEDARVETVEETSRVGGGALPLCELPTLAVKVSFLKGRALDCERHLASKRMMPIICRLKDDALLFDVRTLIGEGDLEEIADAVADFFDEALR